MNDDELDRWLQARNGHLIERLHTSIDVEERLRDTVTKRPPHQTYRWRANVAAAAAASVLLVIATLFAANALLPGSQARSPSGFAAGQSPPPTSTLTREFTSRPEYQSVTGPAGLRTVVPHGWTRTAAPGPGAAQYVDPFNSQRMVRFGGSQTSTEDMLAVHQDYEATFAAEKPGYELIALSSTTFHGAEAVQWEFEYDAAPEAGGRRHVSSLYWLAGDTQYFVYASAPDDEWPKMTEIIASMLEGATP